MEEVWNLVGGGLCEGWGRIESTRRTFLLRDTHDGSKTILMLTTSQEIFSVLPSGEKNVSGGGRARNIRRGLFAYLLSQQTPTQTRIITLPSIIIPEQILSP